ncbi:hypothetical protein ACXYMO_04585 [Arenibacterium sp. CAU 1754]
MNRSFLGAVSALTLIATQAVAWQADNRLTVTALSGGEFEVTGKPGFASPRDYWCAAGDYALSVLGVPGTQRIYITRGETRSPTTGRKTVRFSLTEPAGATQRSSLLLSVDRIGENLGAVFAWNYCLDRKNLDP